MNRKAMLRYRIAVYLAIGLAYPAVYAQGEAGSSATRQPSSAAADAKAEIDPLTEPRIIRGNDRVLAPPKVAAAIDAPASSFRFEDAPIADIVQLVLRDIVKADYVIHPPLSGTVTLATRGEVSADQAVFLLESALQANGIAMVRDPRGTYHLGRPEALKGIVATPRLVGSGPLPPGSGTIIVPLQYIGAGEMAAILRPLVPPESLLRVDTVRNLLILAGTRTQAEGWLDLVATFDVNMLQGMSVGVFPLKYASVSEVEAAFQLLSGGSSARTSTATGTGAAASAPGAAATPSAAVGGGLDINALLGSVRILPIARINSILVVTPRAAYLDEARRWIDKLDRPGTASGESQLYVYAVQNGSAGHLSRVLSGIFGQGTANASSTGSGVAPGLSTTTAATAATTGATTQGSGTTGSLSSTANRTTNATSNIQGTGVSTLNLGSNLRVVADEINNAVLIYGTRGDYTKIEAALRRLDVAPTQVLIEASIIEVTLSDDLQYGLQWAFNDSSRTSGGFTGAGTLSTAAGATFGATSAGFSYSLSNPLGNIRAVLSALAAKSLVNVISSPSLMVLDNHTASITVGNQQPIQSGQTITTGGVISSSIQYKDTGVSLVVTPSVNAGNIVTLQVNQTVTDVGQVDSATQQRAFLQRQFSSKVAVRSGESLVLGGLIRDNTTTGKSGLPLLQDIPLLGNLFGTNSKNTARTELIVVITPRVVRSDQDVREVSQELRERMRGISGNELLRQSVPASLALPGSATMPNSDVIRQWAPATSAGQGALIGTPPQR